MAYTVNIIIKIAIATVAAILFGNGSVVAFNRVPQKWFEDLDDEASDIKTKVLPERLLAADNAGRQRVPSTPWKYIFSGLFLAAGCYLAVTDTLQYEIASLCALFVVLEMAISDELYKIVPDQFQLFLVVLTIGFISFNEKWWEPLAGAGIGLAIGFGVLGLGIILYRKGTIGGADIKFFIGIGCVTGRRGVLEIFILTTLFFAIESVFKIATRRSTLTDHNAMMPAAFAAVLTYLLFLSDKTELVF